MSKKRKLLIVESPAKIKTLSKFLGGEYNIMSTFGHIKDLPSRKLGVEIDNKSGKISIDYEAIKDKKKTISDICKAAKGTDEIYLASDPDREGEIIAWHIGNEIAKVAGKDAKIYRITFNEITKNAVLEAINQKSSIDMEKVNAQQARRILDRWVGYEVSPVLWKKIRKGLSAGRVQSAALLLICRREEAIESFKPEEYWSIHGTFAKNKAKLVAELARINNKNFKLKTKAQTDKALEEIKKQSYFVKDITEKKRLKNPLPPFMTSSLQQESFNKLGFSVDRTMKIAQQLYEGVPLSDPGSTDALITYMRTDSLRLSNTALDAARGFIEKEFGNKYLPKKSNVYSKSAAQDAHEAIRPIDVNVTPEIAHRYLDKEKARLYELIWKRFVASQMMPAEFMQRQLSIEGGRYLFRLTGSTLMFDGFLKVYLVEDEEDKKTIQIPKEIEKGSPLDLLSLDPKQHFTQPPPRYNEASLVKEMEKEGIGRPSTYAATLSTIQKREYVTKDKKKFTPTELGKSVNKMLTENLPDIINISFTAQMEEDLDKIANGEQKRDIVLGVFYKKFKKDVEKFAKLGGGKEAVETSLKCPKCKKTLVIRFGKAGEFIGCSGFPDCQFTSNFTRNEDGKIELVEKQEPMVSDIKCPNCDSQLVQKIGRYGPFLACPKYPECKYIHQEKLSMPCPQDRGTIVKRRSSRGEFWGCSNYPKCKFIISGKPLEKACPICQSPYLLIEKEMVKCPNKECSYSSQESVA